MGRYYNPYTYDTVSIPYHEECDPPHNNEIMVMSEEELKNIPLEEQVMLLKAQVESLGNTLNRCINILNTFQNTTTEYMNFVDMKTEQTMYELHRHSDSFHAMLIVGHKEEKKDESNIP